MKTNKGRDISDSPGETAVECRDLKNDADVADDLSEFGSLCEAVNSFMPIRLHNIL